eukprot:TRINITY_DN3352_c0_g1_i17.p1 TRINITY_DN3352_c0_g1~~TRINITY_DN3352_c0_g1_i17.p1  ORF type:complete len:216 (+),score=45.91 TRINITY_DN3352_c0_g1_i17:229-876(+)
MQSGAPENSGKVDEMSWDDSVTSADVDELSQEDRVEAEDPEDEDGQMPDVEDEQVAEEDQEMESNAGETDEDEMDQFLVELEEPAGMSRVASSVLNCWRPPFAYSQLQDEFLADCDMAEALFREAVASLNQIYVSQTRLAGLMCAGAPMVFMIGGAVFAAMNMVAIAVRARLRVRAGCFSHSTSTTTRLCTASRRPLRLTQMPPCLCGVSHTPLV